MTVQPVVSNSSPIIALDGIGQLDLLEKLFGNLVIPCAVSRETTSAKRLPAWISKVTLTQPTGAKIQSASLGPGESEAISLALELKAGWLLLDDRAARRLAQSLNLPVLGTLGVLLACKRRGHISAVRPILDALVQFSFRVSPALYQRVLTDAGEAP